MFSLFSVGKYVSQPPSPNFLGLVLPNRLSAAVVVLNYFESATPVFFSVIEKATPLPLGESASSEVAH